MSSRAAKFILALAFITGLTVVFYIISDTFHTYRGRQIAHLHDCPINATQDTFFLHSFDSTATSAKPSTSKANVLILTPLKDVSTKLPLYFEKLSQLTFPKEHISLGFLVTDTTDGTIDVLMKEVSSLLNNGTYRKISVFEKNFQYFLQHGSRHKFSEQVRRRQILAKSRNHLLFSALTDEDWVLWLDVDIVTYPSTMLEDMISYDKDVLAANVFTHEKSTNIEFVYDRNNFIETWESRKLLTTLDEDQILVEGYEEISTHRNYLGDLRDSGSDLVEIDGVGGACLLVRADVHRDGGIFPTIPIAHQIETEGFGKLAKKMGKGVYGLPNYVVYHEDV
ncbi:10139_t:CDS:1 [Paraglomus occultum]|uniref:10139_t:CDS:1 n=1 Tax=Paraglomus occultum TaxID=144539 RepID=A0A9N9AIF1_9GLOM|nr:10139_t:CDS:1 [Paraglomus occultum]